MNLQLIVKEICMSKHVLIPMVLQVDVIKVSLCFHMPSESTQEAHTDIHNVTYMFFH